MNSATELGSRLKEIVRRRFSRFRYWNNHSLVVAAAAKVVLFGAAMAVLFSLIGLALVQQRESRRIVEHISGSLSTIESSVRIACFTGDQALAREVANGLLSNKAIASVRITSGANVLAETGKYAGQPFPADLIAVHRKISSPFNDNDQVGEVSLVADDEYIRGQSTGYSLFISWMSLLEMLALSMAVAWVVLRTVVHPIRDLSGQLRAADVNSEVRATPPKNNELNEIGQLAYTFNNLLDWQRELLQSEQQLRLEMSHKEGRYRALAENSPNLIIRYDTDCRRIYCNPAYEVKIGFDSQIALGSRPEQLWNVTNLSAVEYQKILRRVMDAGAPETVTLEWIGTKGQPLISDFHLVPEWDERGEVSSVLAIGHDITLLKMQQQQDMERSHVFEHIVRGGELGEVLGMVAGHVAGALAPYRCAILLDAGQGLLRIAAAPGMPEAYLAALNGFAPAYDETAAHEYWAACGALSARHGMAICRHERILDSGNRMLGLLLLYREAATEAAAVDMGILRQACSLAAITIERKRNEELIRHQASYDALTDLPNRRMFIDRLHEEIAKSERNGGNVTLLFIDLDRFKGVNDTLGHEVGDQLLVGAALRIRQCVREFDLVARLGGDEFVVLIPGAADISHLGRAAKEIVEVLNEPFELNGHLAYVSASIGIASYPSDAAAPDKLVSCADQAMYAAKESGRNGFQFYSAELSESANERLEIEVDLRHAIRRGELELYYQPKVYLEDSRLLGAEALLRWNHPQRGLVTPDKFIGIAEDSGLIVEVGEWVLREACRTVHAWNGPGKPLCKVAVNLSARQFQAPHLYETVCAILAEHACKPEWIELEITESLLLEEGGKVLQTLEQFQRMGISIAIDDFGTGYSALSYLARFPIDTLKIDRSFTSHVTENGHHAELVKAILSIAQSLGQAVVAEGVETAEQALFLKLHGCQVAQGYFYGKPMNRQSFEARMEAAEALSRSAMQQAQSAS